MGVYSSFDDAALDFVDEMPEAIRSIYGTDTSTSAGLVLGAMFSLMAPLMVLVYSISGGTNASTGEERSQTLGLLLANPVSRTRVLLAKTAVVVVGVLLFCVATWGGVEAIAALTGIDASDAERSRRLCPARRAGSDVRRPGAGDRLGDRPLDRLGHHRRDRGGVVPRHHPAPHRARPRAVRQVHPLVPVLGWRSRSTEGVDWPGLVAMLVIAAALAAVSVVLINRRDLRE